MTYQKNIILDPHRHKHIHFMGICGTAMASLAGLLKEKGWTISGSDNQPYPPMSTQIENLGIPLMKGYKKGNLIPKPDLIIVGNVISANNEEAQEMVHLQIPYISLPQALSKWVIEDRESIVISGTHGKTTSTSMMAWVAQYLGQQPGFLIGGVPLNFSKSFQNPKGNYFIVEGDEYDTAYFDKVPKFIHYKPKHVILTSIEYDHADIYPTMDSLEHAFEQLMIRIPENGHLIYWANSPTIQKVIQKTPCKNIFNYGFSDGKLDYSILSVKSHEKGSSFKVYFHRDLLGEFELPLIGGYNILNASSIIAMSHQLGWDLSLVRSALIEFKGVKRRQEILGTPRGICVIEDFAHHPTAVKETLESVVQGYAPRRVFAVFEPRSATSRRKVFQKQYVRAFEQAEEILIAKAYDTSRIPEAERFSSEELVEDLLQLGKKAQAFSNVDDIVKSLHEKTRADDVILIMSNGGFDGIYTKLLKTLETEPEAPLAPLASDAQQAQQAQKVK